MKDKMTKKQIAQRSKDFTHNKYDHGGSRIFINGDSGDRQLIVDTYYDREFAEYIEKCTRDYFGIPDGKTPDTTERSREIVSELILKEFHSRENIWSIDPEEYIQAAKDFGLDELAKEMEECLK